MDLRTGVVLFCTIHDLFRLEKELRGRGLDVKAIPTPRELSSDCGSALRFDMAEVETVRLAVRGLGLEIQGLHQVDPSS